MAYVSKTRFHINPKTGEPGICHAQKNCPFGGEDAHFASKNEARAAYEKQMASRDYEVLKDGADSLSLAQLNKLARATQSSAIVEEIIARGSERSLRNLAKNENVAPEALLRARQKARQMGTEADSTKSAAHALLMNPKYPASAMSVDEFERVWNDLGPYWSQRGSELIESGRIDDEIYDRIFSANTRDRGRILSSPNGLSQEKVIEIVEGASDGSPLAHAVRGGKYPVNERALHFSKQQISALVAFGSNIDFSQTPNLAQRVRDLNYSEAAARLVHNPTLSDQSVATLAEVLDGKDLAHAYNHPNASAKTKDLIEGMGPWGASAAKLDRLSRTHPDLRAEIVSSDSTNHPFGRSRGISDITVQLDTEKVKSLGLDRNDIMLLMNSWAFNGGSGYDEATGIFKGTIDSTD